jgi:DNA repair exonuclease SbcCD nuclease subunit
MTKFLFFTDSHMAGESPRHRTDDFPRTIIEKQREVYSLAQNEGCEFVAFGGDWFNYYRLFNYEILADSMDIVCGSNLQTYIVVGEHDIYGHNMSTYPSSTLAFFVRRCGRMTVLWEPTEVAGVVLHGKHEPDKMDEMLTRPLNADKVNVMVCHELITCNDAPFEMIKTDTLRNTGYDLIVSGDLHDGYQPHQVDGTWFCNPGSLVRRSTSDADRWPQVAIISIEKGNVEIEYRRLKCGRAGSEVFGESIAEVAKDGDVDASAFTTELLQFEAEATDVHDLVQMAGTKAGLRDEVLKYLASKRIPVSS